MVGTVRVGRRGTLPLDFTRPLPIRRCYARATMPGFGRNVLLAVATLAVLAPPGAAGPLFATPFLTLGTRFAPYSVAIDDLDADGKPDLVVAEFGAATLSTFRGNGDGTFGPRTDYATQGGPYSVAIGDVNGDGRLDVAMTNYVPPYFVSVFLGNGDGTLGARIDNAAGLAPLSVVIADLNAD